MTTLDDRLVPKVLALIAKFGKAATMHAKYSDVNVATGRTSTTPDTYAVVVTPPSPAKTKYIDGDVVTAQSVQTMIAASGLAFTPEVGMRIVFDSVHYKVTLVQSLYTGEQVAAYRMFAER